MFRQRLFKTMSAQGTVLEKDPNLAKQSAALPLNHLSSISSLPFPSPSCLVIPLDINCAQSLPAAVTNFLQAAEQEFRNQAFHRDVSDWNQIQCLTAVKNIRK